jgi:hypothetical protein
LEIVIPGSPRIGITLVTVYVGEHVELLLPMRHSTLQITGQVVAERPPFRDGIPA